MLDGIRTDAGSGSWIGDPGQGPYVPRQSLPGDAADQDIPLGLPQDAAHGGPDIDCAELSPRVADRLERARWS